MVVRYRELDTLNKLLIEEAGFFVELVYAAVGDVLNHLLRYVGLYLFSGLLLKRENSAIWPAI